MKNLHYITLVSVMLASCSPSAPKDGYGGFDRIAPADSVRLPVRQNESVYGEHLHAYWDTANGSGVYCEDTTLYSMDFVQCLRSLGLPNLVELRDGSVFGDGPEPISIQSHLLDTMLFHFAGRDRHGMAELTVRRLNYTTVLVEFMRSESGQEVVNFNGLCDIGCGFIFGAESEDGEQGAYFVDEYWSRDGEHSFRIGKDGEILNVVAVSGKYGSNRTESPRMRLIPKS